MNQQTKAFSLSLFLSLGMACSDDLTKTSTNNVNNTNNNTVNNVNNTTGSNNANNVNNVNNTSGLNNLNPSSSCKPPEELEEVDFELWTNSECSERSPDRGQRVYTSVEELMEDIDCIETVELGIDFSTHRLVYVSVFSNPSIALQGVVEDENGAIRVYTSSSAYCGGAAPPNSGLFVLVPADTREVVHTACTFGSCDSVPPGR